MGTAGVRPEFRIIARRANQRGERSVVADSKRPGLVPECQVVEFRQSGLFGPKCEIRGNRYSIDGNRVGA